MFDDNDTSTGKPEKYTKEEFRKMESDARAEEVRQNAMRDAEKAQDKARARAAENAEYADKRQPKSDLIRQAELSKMKEILNMPKSGGGGGSGRGGPSADMKQIMNPRSITYKKGGKVTASSRADGCAKRGKTKGRMV